MQSVTRKLACFIVRSASNEDLSSIHAWLLDERSRGNRDSFLCNWELTLGRHERGDLNVCVDSLSGQVVGYQWGDLTAPGILEVRRDFRRRGVGTALVRHRLNQARRRNECLLLIQCTPETSIPFWKAMGFEPVSLNGEETHAYRILSRRHRLPQNTRKASVEVTIRFERLASPIIPYSRATPDAVKTPNGVIHLAERVVCFTELHRDVGDPIFKVTVNGELRFHDKAKRPLGERIGIRRCDNGFYLDQIHPTP